MFSYSPCVSPSSLLQSEQPEAADHLTKACDCRGTCSREGVRNPSCASLHLVQDSLIVIQGYWGTGVPICLCCMKQVKEELDGTGW